MGQSGKNPHGMNCQFGLPNKYYVSSILSQMGINFGGLSRRRKSSGKKCEVEQVFNDIYESSLCKVVKHKEIARGIKGTIYCLSVMK